MPSNRFTPPAPTYRDALANRELQVVLASWVVSMLGNVVSHVALAVLVLARTGSPLLSALSFAAGFIPYVVGGSLLSSIGDRYPPRAVLIVIDLLQAALVAAMLLPGMPVWGLLALVSATGVVAPVYQGTRSATLPDMMSAETFPLARALLRMVAMGAQVVGFGVGGALLVVLSPETLLALNAASFVVSALLLRLGTRARPARLASLSADGTRPSVLRASLTGVVTALRSPSLRPLLLLAWLPPMFAVVPEGLAAPYAQAIEAPSYGVGVLLGAGALGSVLGSVVVGTWATPARRESLIRPLVLIQLAPLLVFVTRPPLLVAAAAMLALGLGTAYELGLDQRLLAALDDDNRGLVLSVSSSGLMLTQGLGFAAGGAAAEFLPVTVVVAGAGALGLVAAALLVRSAGSHRGDRRPEHGRPSHTVRR